MNNTSISKAFADVAILMQAKGENVFKVRAYSRASDVIRSLPYPVSELVEEPDRLREIPGFGEAIVGKVQELVQTGQLELLESLLKEMPEGVLDLVQIPGIGPATAFSAAQDLGIGSFKDLANSIESGLFQSLPRITKKNSLSILRHVKMRIEQGTRIGIGRAQDYATDVIIELELRCPNIARIVVAGDIRRGVELVHSIDLICAVDDEFEMRGVIDSFTTLSNTYTVLRHDDSSAKFLDKSGLGFSIKVVKSESFGGALVYATGSNAHLEKLKAIAAGAGSTLSPDGLFDLELDSPIDVEDEKNVFDYFGLIFVPPEMREDTGEIERAVEDHFPSIISLNDIRGDLHCHTDWSDGRFPMDEMVEAAQSRGLEYLAITDHSPSATVANGLTPDRLNSHNHTVRTMGSDLAGIELLTGTEMDIKPDGSLDYSDEVLSDLDIVIASIHSAMDQDQAIMTKRVISAMQSPHVDVICHLTARLLERRAPVMMDVESVLEAAVLTGTVMEINCSPDRLDLKADHVRRAVELGVIFAINTDSHRINQFDNLRFGVQTAIRGWVEKKQVVNTLTFHELRRFLNLPKSDRYEFMKSRG